MFGAVWAPKKSFDNKKIEILGREGEVEVMKQDGVGILFSNLGVDGKLKATRRAAKRHSQILTDLLLDHGALAPVPFGTVIESEQELREMLQNNEKEIEKTLHNIDNQVEYGMKVYWDPDEVAGKLAEDSHEIQQMKSIIKQGGGGNTYEATLEVGELIEEKMEDKRKELKAATLGLFNAVINDWVENEPFDDRMAVNLAFLLDKDAQENLDDAVEELGKTQPEYLTIKYSGPWPPFNFVELKLR